MTQTMVDGLAWQGIAVNAAKTVPRMAENFSAVRLRFDRVALRFVKSFQASLGAIIPDGRTLVVTITAPIRLPARTAAVLEEKIRRVLARGAVLEVHETIHGNRVTARLLRRRITADASAIGFVHNRDSDPEILFAAMRALLA
jgi:hypothetical protein